MSSLPQRKKSAEEIAKLRESLGVPPEESGASLHPSAKPSVTSAAPEAPADASPTPETPSTSAPPRQKNAAATASPGAFHPGAPATPIRTKPVRSLKKSEQVPIRILSQPTSEKSSLPTRRRNNKELEEIRKREALARLDPPQPNPKIQPAHPAMVAPGYLLCAASAGYFYIDKFPLAASAACAGAAMLCAMLLYFLRPISRHHAGFIVVITLFVSVFGALHYFPNLQYAT